MKFNEMSEKQKQQELFVNEMKELEKLYKVCKDVMSREDYIAERKAVRNKFRGKI